MKKRANLPVLAPDKMIFILSVKSDFLLYAVKVRPVTILIQDIKRPRFLKNRYLSQNQLLIMASVGRGGTYRIENGVRSDVFFEHQIMVKIMFRRLDKMNVFFFLAFYFPLQKKYSQNVK